MHRPLGTFLGVFLGVATLASSCLLADFSVVPSSGEGGALVGGGSGTGGAGGAAICPHATWPSPPTDPPEGDAIEIVAALRTIDLGEDFEDSPTLGYDLDGRCSCQGEEDRCSKPDYVTNSNLLCDGEEGLDNNAARIFKQAAGIFPAVSSSSFTQGLEAGQWTLLWRIRGYNGEPDDAQVEVALYPSPGLRFDPCNDPADVPLWDGSDQWPVHAFSVQGGGGTGGGGTGGAGTGGGTGGGQCSPDPDPAVDQPTYVDTNAYVSGGIVVASLPKTNLAVSGGALPTSVSLAGGFMTARLEPSGDSYALRDGVLVGRWPAEDVLEDIAGFVVEDGMTLCTDDTLYTGLKNIVCGYVDIETTVGGPTAPCDAISIGLGFEAEPARLGSVYLDPGTPMECPPGTDPADDQCGR